MASSSYQLYTAAQALSYDLARAGEREWSVAIQRAMSGSSVGGEVRGELRAVLEALRNAETPRQPRIRKDVRRLLRELE